MVYSKTLNDVKNRGYVIVAMGQEDVGPQTVLDINFGSCLASAIFGNPAKVQYINSPTWGDRIPYLLGGAYYDSSGNLLPTPDVSFSVLTQKTERDVGYKITFSPIYYIDTVDMYGILGSTKFGAEYGTTGLGYAMQYVGASSYSPEPAPGQIVTLYGSDNTVKGTVKIYASSQDSANGFCVNEFDLYFLEGASIANFVAKTVNCRVSEGATRYGKVLPGLDTIAAGVRNGDSGWQEIVSWVIYATYKAAEWGWTSLNIDQKRSQPRLLTQEQRRFLGLDLTISPTLNMGLPNDWAYRVIRNCGNYNEIYQNSFGVLPAAPNISVKLPGGCLFSPKW